MNETRTLPSLHRAKCRADHAELADASHVIGAAIHERYAAHGVTFPVVDRDTHAKDAARLAEIERDYPELFA